MSMRRAVAAGLDRRRAGVAGGRADDGHPLAARASGPRSKSRPRSCSARSLKASVGPWNSSSSQSSLVELDERRHRAMAEAGVGLGDERRRAALADDAAAGERGR